MITWIIRLRGRIALLRDVFPLAEAVNTRNQSVHGVTSRSRIPNLTSVFPLKNK